MGKGCAFGAWPYSHKNALPILSKSRHGFELPDYFHAVHCVCGSCFVFVSATDMTLRSLMPCARSGLIVVRDAERHCRGGRVQF